jgi:hypothetical protein
VNVADEWEWGRVPMKIHFCRKEAQKAQNRVLFQNSCNSSFLCFLRLFAAENSSPVS